MEQHGQHGNALFVGLDSDSLKTFSIEVDSRTASYALDAMEKAINELRLCQLQFGFESRNGVRARVNHS